MQEYLINDKIELKFIPPRSPHFGELLESTVKSMKNLLFKVLGESHNIRKCTQFLFALKPVSIPIQ